MALPALVGFEAFAARIAGGVSDADRVRAEALLEDASALVRKEAGATWVTGDAVVDVPEIVVTITVAVAKRAFENPRGAASETTGPFGVQYPDHAGDLVFLTESEQKTLQRLRGGAGLWTLSTTRGDPTCDTEYLVVDPPGQPIPFLSASEPF